MSGYRRYLRLPGRTSGDRRAELNDEIESHIAMRAEDLMRSGATPEAARRQAEARFGDRDSVLQSARERDHMLRRRERLATVGREIRLAARQARRAPGPTLLTVLTYAFGIGLTTAMFTIVNGVLLRPLPYFEPDRLVVVQGMDSAGNTIDRTSYANWLDLAERNRTLESTALHEPARLAVNSDAGAYRVSAQIVSPSFFDVLGTRMIHGRGFTAADAEPGTGAVIVSEALWRRELSGRMELGGRTEQGGTLQIENATHVVIGVVADEQAYPAGTQLWLPRQPQPRMSGFFRNYIGAEAIARLRPGVARAAAEADLSAIARQVQAAEPESDYMYGAPLLPLHERVVGGMDRYLVLLMGAVGVVLLLACVNLAALNLARATRRTGEVAVRYALGATRRAVVRQLMIEQFVLALAGGMLGLLLAWSCTRLMIRAAGDQLPRAHEIGLDSRVLLFAAAAALIAATLAGIAPAWRASAASARSLVGGRGFVGTGRGVPGAVLVGAEIAAAVVLLVGAGLLVRSFQTLVSRDVGFAAAGIASADIALRPAASAAVPDANTFGPGRDDRVQRWQEILSRVAADPSIAATAVANWIPTGRGGTGYLLVDGHPEDPAGTGYSVVSENYFDALGIPVLLGRTFTASDAADGQRVGLVSRSMAERYWPDTDPIGQRFRVPGMEGPRETAPSITVIGVVGDVRQDGYEDDGVRSQVYVLYRQVPDWAAAMTLIARHSRGDAAAAGAVMRRELRTLDPTLAVEPESLDRRLDSLVSERRLVTTVLSGFGILALLLAITGVYSMLSFAVAQRTREIGIRTALGASQDGIVRLILTAAARVVGIGAAAGLLLASWLTTLLEGMLVDVARLDPIAWAAAVALLVAVALVAALLPARRAARLDPLVALTDGS